MNFDDQLLILGLLAGLMLGSFVLACLLDWLLRFHEPEDQ